MSLNEWQNWPAVTDELLASTPVQVKMEWGHRFGQIVPKAFQQFGPVSTFDSVQRLINERKIELRCMLSRHRGSGYKWRVEYRLTAAGAEYIRVH